MRIGIYKPESMRLQPEILHDIQRQIGIELDRIMPFDLVFNVGSGSSPYDIWRTVDYGVAKTNVDTDTQYAFTRSIAAYISRHYDSALKIDTGVGGEKYYDPRSCGRAAESAMAKRVIEACQKVIAVCGEAHDLRTGSGQIIPAVAGLLPPSLA